MLYRRQTNSFINFFSLKNIATIIFVILIILIENINPSIITTPLQSIAISLAFVKNNTNNVFSGLFSSLQLKERLNQENLDLKKQYASLSTFCAASIQSLKSSRDELEKSLGRKNYSLKSYIGTGYVIAKPPIAPYGTVIIDLGDKSGVKIGNQAIVGENIIGLVLETKSDRAIIKLFGEKDESMPILIGTQHLLLSGQGQGFGTYKIRVANESGISIGENVWLSNAPNYLFGSVISINQSSSDQYQDLTIRSPLNIFELSSVDIVSNESL